MNDFGDEEATEAFGHGLGPSSEALPSDVVAKTEPPSVGVKPEAGTDAPSSSATDYGGGNERTGSSVYIANLQWWTTDADVERLCSTYGQVLNINFLAERSNGKSKGVALVEFSDGQAATRCKEGLSGGNIHGRNCVVTFPSQSFPRSYGSGGRYGYGHYDRGRMSEGRGRGRGGRGYGHGGYDPRPGMGMPVVGEMPGYMHEMGMVDMPPDVIPPMEGHLGQHGPGYVPPPPYPMPGAGGYMHDDHYDQPYYRRGERWDHTGQDEMAQKRQRPTS